MSAAPKLKVVSNQDEVIEYVAIRKSDLLSSIQAAACKSANNQRDRRSSNKNHQ